MQEGTKRSALLHRYNVIDTSWSDWESEATKGAPVSCGLPSTCSVSVLTCEEIYIYTEGCKRALVQNSTAVSSAGPGRAVSHADASEPAQPRKQAGSARAVDRASEEAPFASASSVAKRAAARALASAWEIARSRAAVC